MLDRDLADLYGAETKFLNLAVKRNIKRFPKDFMFQLTKEEFDSIRLQVETLDIHDSSLRLQNATLKKGRGQHSKYMPYVFTEQGVAMLSGILTTDRAIQMNIAIMRAFVEIRRILLKDNDLNEQLKEIKEITGEHNVQLSQIYQCYEEYML